MYLKFGLKGGIIVSTPEVAKEIFKKHDLAFSQRPELIVADILVTNKEGMSLRAYPSWQLARQVRRRRGMHSESGTLTIVLFLLHGRYCVSAIQCHMEESSKDVYAGDSVSATNAICGGTESE